MSPIHHSATTAAAASKTSASAGDCVGASGRRRTAASAASAAGVIGMSQADGQMGQLGGGRLRIVEHELAGHSAAFIFVRVIHAVDPIVGPLGFFLFGLVERVLPQGCSVVLPSWRNGGIAGGGGQRVEIGLRWNLGIGQRVAINKNRADDLAPVFAGGDVALRAAAVVCAAPVIEDDRIGIVVGVEMADQFLFGSAAAQVFDGRVDEPDADVILRARPAISRNFVLDGVVTVFVLDGIFVVAGAQNALLLRVDDDARAPILRRAFEHIAVGVHRNPIEVMVELGDIAAFAYAHRAVSRRVGENCVGINAAVTAAHRVADFNVAICSASGRARREHHRAAGDAFDGDLRARAAVFRRVNCDGVGQLGAPCGVSSQYPPPPMVSTP